MRRSWGRPDAVCVGVSRPHSTALYRGDHGETEATEQGMDSELRRVMGTAVYLDLALAPIFLDYLPHAFGVT